MTPALSTKQHAGQNGMIICTILMAGPMLLCSRVLVEQCHLAAASSRKAAATPAAVDLTHKEIASSIASGSNHSKPSHDHRASIRAKISRSLKGSASSVVVLAIKPRSVN